MGRKLFVNAFTVPMITHLGLIIYTISPQLDADDVKVVLEEEPGTDVYAESPLP